MVPAGPFAAPLVFTAVLFCCSLSAAALDSEHWHLSAEVTTDLPVQVGGRIQLETPHRIRLSTALGVMPGGYVQLINAVLVDAGAYPDATADLIESTLKESLVWRTHVGWRPFSDHGFYFEVGYTLVTLGGAATGQELLAGIVGASAPAGAGESRDYDVASTLHLFDFELGWEWVLWDALTLRAAIGLIATVAASSTVEARFDVVPALRGAVDSFERFSESYLVDTYTSYVFSPVASVGLGYRFF